MSPASIAVSSGPAVGAAPAPVWTMSPRTQADADARACRINVIGSRGLRRVAVEIGMVLEIQLPHDPARQLAALRICTASW